MLKLIIPQEESFDEATNRFVVTKATILEFEHSLASLSKWESTFERPFLSNDKKSSEEVIAYVEMMLLTPDVSVETLESLTQVHYDKINQYISSKQTATTINEVRKGGRGGEVITAEIIYYWMVSMGIPFECQYWHLNRLLMLIKVINRKNEPSRKLGRNEAARKQRELNEQRRAQFNTRG